MQRTTLAAAALILGALGTTAGLAAPANAAPTAPARSYPCGYDGYNGSSNDLPLYNHCGRGDIVLKVNHFFWQTTYMCAEPGIHYLNQGTSGTAIIGAEADGHTCTAGGSNLEGP